MPRPPVTSPMAAKPPHFFKIIHSAVIQEGRLRIPRKFMESVLKGISDAAILKVPGGKVWRVKLKKEKDELWLHKGFKEFMEYYAINTGHLLVFRYNGFSQFNVIIFDMSATEIVYPFDSSDSEAPHSITDDETCEEDVSVEILDAIFSLKQKTPMKQLDLGKFEKEGTSLKHKQQLKQPRKENRGTTLVNSDSRPCKKKDSCRTYRKKCSDAKKEESANAMVVANREPISSMIYTKNEYRCEERKKLVQTARRLKLRQPLAAITLTPSYINKGFLYFPSSFSHAVFSDELKHSVERVKKRAHLSKADGRTWPVDLIFHAGQVCLGGGWRPFVRENNLSEGNFCFFELVKKGCTIDFKVSTSRPRN
ncbi:hypothetical protein Sjap_010143 [Stephania japonica]|uniref:TF-B3 domain-containing protein n=1 Tax=Stephania japonica TaxID=461633 RepID=A0AAP0P6V3_9MAGN